MFRSAVCEDYLDALWTGPSRDVFRIGLAVPTSGVMGLTGPAGVGAAVVAVEKAQAASVLGDREIRLVPLDAGDRGCDLAAQVDALIEADSLDGIVGYHTSVVRTRLQDVVAARIPYVFTPPHEGGPPVPGVGLLGPSPDEQIRPLAALAETASLRRWALVGTDYIWPQSVHAAARRLLPRFGASVVLDQLVPFYQVDPERLIGHMRRRRVQGVLLSLVGRDLATFNRAFADSPLAGRVVRVSGALEEAGLLEIGGDDTGALYSTMPWFAPDDDLDELAARYVSRWGPQAPRLGAYAEGCYDGVSSLIRLEAAGHLEAQDFPQRLRHEAPHRPARLAIADGLDLHAVRWRT